MLGERMIKDNLELVRKESRLKFVNNTFRSMNLPTLVVLPETIEDIFAGDCISMAVGSAGRSLIKLKFNHL
jgi:hypothetical protein